MVNLRKKNSRAYELENNPKEWFKDVSPDSIETIILYHGTSSLHLESILKEGLKPRNETGISTWEADQIESQPNKVYLGTRYIAKKMGEAAVHRHTFYEKVHFSKILEGEVFLVLIELEVDTSNLAPDEDSGELTWYQSLMMNRTCAYNGRVPPEKIRRIWKFLGDSSPPFERGELIYDPTKNFNP
jgi:hypothetical protein